MVRFRRAWACTAVAAAILVGSADGRAGRGAGFDRDSDAHDARISSLIAQVSADRIATRIQSLESYGTRYFTTSQARAAAIAIAEDFRQAGLTVQTEAFTVDGSASSNVIATIPGRVSPAQIVIVGAHYDSYAPRVYLTTAPGADDNASGAAGVMEIARVLSGQPFECTIRLIAFGAEENNFDGSRVHAVAARARGDAIVAMLNMDMIGYVDRAPEDLDVTANTASAWLADRFVETAKTYTGVPILKLVDPTSRFSDHVSFWDQGYAAVEIIEDDHVPNPYYHTVNDRFPTLDMAFVTSVVKTTLAVAAALAKPTDGQPVPTFTDDPLAAGVTPVKAVHITELRTEIDARRSHHGLAPFGWTDPTIVAGVTAVSAVHLTELRTALAEVYAAAGRASPVYSSPFVEARTSVITATQIAELRAAVGAIW